MKKEKVKKPKVNPCDWITIGKGTGLIDKLDAVVCQVHDDSDYADIEVVYLDDRNRAINEDVIWDQSHWEFKNQGPCGGYADRYSRLAEFVAILRRGRY